LQGFVYLSTGCKADYSPFHEPPFASKFLYSRGFILTTHSIPPRIQTGITGLDEVLDGGFVPQRAYLLLGGPGTGKTTLGMHFLATGIALNERCLFINLGEAESQIKTNASGIGINLDTVHFLDLRPTSDVFRDMQTYDIFHAAEVEREPITKQIVSTIEALKPQRVFLDTVTHFRYLAPDDFQFRKQMHSFLRFLMEQGATVVFTAEESREPEDNDLQYMCDGMIYLENNTALGRRAVSIVKYRGSAFSEGRHAVKLTRTGMKVFPRLQPKIFYDDLDIEALSSGIQELDALLHGGLERRTISIISGPTGVGKTLLGMQFMKAAAERGERSVIYAFEEWTQTIINRAEATNTPVRAMLDTQILSIVQVDPLQYSPEEFALMVRRDVEEAGTSIVMIDSIAGYELSLKGSDLVSHLHALSKYLQSIGVTVLLINEVNEIMGDFKATEVGISYMCDNLIFLRYIEFQGEIRRVMGVLKKRLSGFEATLREFDITPDGIKLGKPLKNLRGLLTGNPELLELNLHD
jgi:circadian clock protein KaiC